MFWPRHSGVLQSAIFRRAVVTSAASLAVVIVLFWIAFAIYRWQSLGDVKEEVRETAREIQMLMREEGRRAVLEELTGGEVEVWEPEWLHDAFHEDELIFRVSNRQGDTLMGTDLLQASARESITYVDYEELSRHPIFVVRLDFARTGHTLLLGRFVPSWLPWGSELLWMGTRLLLLAFLPIALVTAWLTSRAAFQRLTHIALTAEAVAEGKLDARAPVGDTEDEFDRLSMAVNEMLDRIDGLTKHLKGVSIGAAHDLKTPVSNLGGRLELMERDIGDTEALENHIDAAKGHISTLLRTLDAMLRLGEIEAGRRRNAFRMVDVSSLCQDLTESMAPVFEDADKHLTVKVAPALKILGDQDLIVQLLVNLLENAIEHTRDGAHVEIRVQGVEGEVVIEVADDGPGIPDTVGERIFERFHRLEVSRGSAGNGLGLSLVRSIAELHEGSACLASTTPGATFRVALPRHVGA